METAPTPGGSMSDAQPLTTASRLNHTVTTKASTKGQIVLPAELRRLDGIQPGEEFEIERVSPDEYRLVRVSAPANSGLVDLLLECPEKGYFTPIDSESTETL
jgi:AbrB family looped-hinge helix DNA binding protein